MQIEQLQSIEKYHDELVELLIQVVEDSGSIGFLPPLSITDATNYWESVLSPGVILYVAKLDGRIAGTIQLQLCQKQNGKHRAEVAKLMTHPSFRNKGIARQLMQTVEARAKQEGRSLLVLDTRDGDPSNQLYLSLNYLYAGQIPNYAESENGKLSPTNFYYKII